MQNVTIVVRRGVSVVWTSATSAATEYVMGVESCVYLVRVIGSIANTISMCALLVKMKPCVITTLTVVSGVMSRYAVRVGT